MRLRSVLKIERIVEARYPNAKPFRAEVYDALWQELHLARAAWERLRDEICPASRCYGRGCVCSTDPRLINPPLRLKAQELTNEINRLDREAYDKLVKVRAELSSMYFRVNELKNKS